MQNEIIKTLSDITDTELISKMLLNMNNRDMFILMSLLDHTDTVTQDRWLSTYNQLTKY